MRAAVRDRFGPPDVVRVEQTPTPTPQPGQLLVRVHAAAVSTGDARIRAGRFPRGFGHVGRLVFGVRRPRHRILGGTFSGVVEAVGAKVTGVSVGDEVCGMTGMAMGTHAEYAVVPATRAVPKPGRVGHDDAAGVLFGGSTALHYLRDKAALQAGQSVLVIGASGAIGTNAVQLAKHLGAQVTAVTSARNTDLVRRLGADHVVDYTVTPVTTLAERFDVVLDTVGTLSPATGRRLLTDDGVLLLAVATLWQTVTARGRVKAGPAPERAEAFGHLLRLVEDGSLTVVLDQVLDLDHVAAAHERVDSGRKVGNVVVRP